MFATLLADRTDRFDTFVRAALGALTAVFLISVAFGVLDMGAAPVDQLADNATVTIEIVSIDALLPDLGGALINLPIFRL